MKMKVFYSILLFLLCLSPLHGQAENSLLSEKDMSAYLMVYFKDDTHGLYMAISTDGYIFTDINNGRPVIEGDTIALQKGIRDPHIYRGPDNVFYLAMTDLHIYAKRAGYRTTDWERPQNVYGWGNNRGFVLMKSIDLIHWTRTNIRVDQSFPGLENIGCAWAPETIYDERAKKLMIYFSMRFGKEPPGLYYSYINDDYSRLETEPKLLFTYPKDNISTIDADIIKVGQKYHMFYTPNDGMPGIKQAISSIGINTGYVYNPQWVDPEPRSCEAPNVWKRIGEDKWVVMYDVYGITPHNFGFSETSDFETFTNIGYFNNGVMKTTNFVSPKHGAVIHITTGELQRLEKEWNFNGNQVMTENNE